MLLHYLSLLPVVEADFFYSFISTSMPACAEKPCPPVTTDINVLYIADLNESTLDGQILVHIHYWMIYVLLIPLQICLSFAAAVCNQFALFLLSYTTNEYADSTVLSDWQFSDSQDHVSSVMKHVAPVQANLNPINAELFASLVGKASSVSNHMTHSRICYTVVQALLTCCKLLILL